MTEYKTPPAGFFIKELFPFEKKTYGVLKSVDNDKFMRFVLITSITDKGYNWETLNETLEKAIAYFYHEKKK